MQTDPVGHKDDIDLYTYVGNDPEDKTDPSGETWSDLLTDPQAPRAIVETIVGAAMIIGGTGGDGGSALVTAGTGGAALPLTVPAAIASTGLIVGGLVATAHGAATLANIVNKNEAAPINEQKQAGHTPGTPQNANRPAQGNPTSTFFSKAEGETLTQDTHQTGTPAPNRPGLTVKEYGRPVGTGPRGGTQSRVTVHQDSAGQIHGHPSGPETPQ